jgi:YbbR domain-containing protein
MEYHPFRHLGLKVLSIALAVALWLTVGDQRAVERPMRIPLEYHNMPADLELVDGPPETVEVRLRGPSGNIGRLTAGDVMAVLDLTGAREGSRLFHLLTDEVRVPYGVHVSAVNPSTVSLSFERSKVRTVPVVPALEGNPAAGYLVGRIKADPEIVSVVGPASQVDGVTKATTEPVLVGGATANVVDRVTVGVTNDQVRLVQPQSATVTVEVLRTAVEKRLPAIVVRTRMLASGRSARVDPAEVGVVVRGPAGVIDRLSDVSAFVDLAGVPPGRFSLPVRVDPLAGLEVVRTEPATVDVRVR